MQTQVQDPKKKETPKGLILVGHYHHEAQCECGTATRVESYYKQLPQIMCPSCQKPCTTHANFHKDAAVSTKTVACVGCGCRFAVTPTPANMLCPTCIHPPDEVDGPGA